VRCLYAEERIRERSRVVRYVYVCWCACACVSATRSSSAESRLVLLVVVAVFVVVVLVVVVVVVVVIIVIVIVIIIIAAVIVIVLLRPRTVARHRAARWSSRLSAATSPLRIASPPPPLPPSSLLSVALAGGHRTEGVRATGQASRYARWLCVADERPTNRTEDTNSP